ncbi:MAG: M1 family metallopeptidase [Candidatus Marinimicrobia bacterium]|nr:M1 family metallopeptidase [Candidatus Neomarinimicrobiota bacterium]
MLKLGKTIAMILCFGLALSAHDYYQNEVNYKINVTLDDSRHLLEGTEKIIYYNHFPQPLEKICLLLYPNAYKNEQTHFARQQKKYGKTEFLNSKEHQRGYIAIDSISVAGKQANLLLPADSITIGYIDLEFPLRTGDSIEIFLDWTVKIPESFSRMCHSGQKYYITQWFPKIPVYDERGWHPYPYLTVGEFFYEFGDYEVSITLPENYVVAATGTLVSPRQEMFFLDSLKNVGTAVMDMNEKEFRTWHSSHKNPPSREKLKKLTYKAENVVDFAWTASKEHLVQRSNFAYENSTDSIAVWNFFLPENRESWKYALEASKKTLVSYGNLCGPYPFPQVTSVDGDLTAGGGMEYPMLTIINASKNQMAMWQVIGHEIGHNWFYGILGFDERMQPWMDEGLNTYGEMRFLEEQLPDSLALLGQYPRLKNHLDNLNTQNLYLLALMNSYHMNLIERGDQDSWIYEKESHYFISVYQRPSMGLRLMEASVGSENFTQAMNQFYEEWKFKHPKPIDMQHSFEKILQKDLDWFFVDYIQTSNIPDYQLKRFEVRSDQDQYVSKVILENKGKSFQPYNITLFKDKNKLAKQWYFGDQTELEIPTEAKPDQAVINADLMTIESDYMNNRSALLPPIDANFILDLPTPNQFLLNYVPYLNYNYNEGLKIGGGFYHLSPILTQNMILTYGNYATKTDKLNWALRYQTFDFGKRTRSSISTHFSVDEIVNKAKVKLSANYLNEISMKSSLAVSCNFINLHNSGILDKALWKSGKYALSEVHNDFSLIFGNSKLKNNISLSAIMKDACFSSSPRYMISTSLEIDQKVKKYKLKNRMYLGTLIGRNGDFASQFDFYPNGGIDPGFDQFYVYDRSGRTALDPGNNFLISEGANLKGYQQKPAGKKWSLGYNAEICRGLLFLFFDAGNVFNKKENFSLVWDAGAGLDFKLIQFYFPVYVSEPYDGFDPVSNWKALKKRWVVTLTLPTISLFN